MAPTSLGAGEIEVSDGGLAKNMAYVDRQTWV